MPNQYMELLRLKLIVYLSAEQENVYGSEYRRISMQCKRCYGLRSNCSTFIQHNAGVWPEKNTIIHLTQIRSRILHGQSSMASGTAAGAGTGAMVGVTGRHERL